MATASPRLYGLAAALLAQSTSAQWETSLNRDFFELTPSPFDIEIHTGIGSSQGTLKWHISGGSNGPNVLSELTYRDVEFKHKSLSAILNLYQGLLADSHLFVHYRLSEASSGTIQDSDFNSDNRQDEYSRSHSSAAGSSMDDMEVGAGHRWALTPRQSVTGRLSYFHKEQAMSMTEGVQILNTYNPNALGPFRNTLNSRYDNQWNGMWLGGQWQWASEQHSLGIELKHYWYRYHAVADWNLRTDFAHPKSFEQWANGTGIGYRLSYQFHVNRNVALSLDWWEEDWETYSGDDVVYFANGETGQTRLNEVSWKATFIAAGMSVAF